MDLSPQPSEFTETVVLTRQAAQGSPVLVLGSRQVLQLGQQALCLIALPKQNEKEDLNDTHFQNPYLVLVIYLRGKRILLNMYFYLLRHV